MKISVIIPNYNGADYLAECLKSVLTQDYADKEIIVMDGGSNDLSVRILCEHDEAITHWESAPDPGPYHAVEKGLNMATGEILYWVNSDDILLPGALTEAAAIFEAAPEVEWLTGMHSTFLDISVLRAKGYPTTDFFLSDDTRFAVQLFRNIEYVDWTLDYVLNDAPHGGYFLQQESTFWRRGLWKSVGGFDHHYSLAADYWLWLEFLERAPLTIVDRPFGSFRQTMNQRSAMQAGEYKREALEIAGRCQARRDCNNSSDPSPQASPLVQVRNLVKDQLCLATSIAPVNVEKQAFCIKTWLRQGCRVLSFNTDEEIERIQSEGNKDIRDVEFVPVTETAKDVAGKDLVFLRDIIAHYQKFDPETVLGIVNSDIMIEHHIDLLSFGRSHCQGSSCLISSRVDVEDFWDREGQIFSGGLDAFLFRSPHIQDFPMDVEFAIGAPWWDYFLPHYFRGVVERIHYPRPIPFYHKRHTTNYPTALWVHYGEHFLKHFDSDLAAKFAEVPGDGYQSEFLAAVARQFAIDFYNHCTVCSPIEWAGLAPYGNGFHARLEHLQSRVRQWADRAILAEELLQTRNQTA